MITGYGNRRRQGFTLIEVMVVVVILGILAAVVVPRIMDRPDEARIVKAKNDIRVLQTQLALYRMDNFNYPTTDQGLEALVVKTRVAAGTAKMESRWLSGAVAGRPLGTPLSISQPRREIRDRFIFAGGRRSARRRRSGCTASAAGTSTADPAVGGRRRPTTGFTLLEVLLVLALIGIISSFAWLNIDSSPAVERLAAEAERLAALVEQQRFEATLTGEQRGLVFAARVTPRCVLARPVTGWLLASRDNYPRGLRYG